MTSLDSFQTKRELNVNGQQYHYFSLPALEAPALKTFLRYPTHSKFCWKIYYATKIKITVTATTSKQSATGSTPKPLNVKFHIAPHVC